MLRTEAYKASGFEVLWSALELALQPIEQSAGTEGYRE